MKCVLRAAWAVLAASLCVWAAPASATVMATSTPIASCSTSRGTVSNCDDTTFYSTVPATETTSFISGNIDGRSPLTADFQTAFNDWDAANGNAWTLVNGGTLNLTLTTALAPNVMTSGAGISPIIVTVSNYVPGASDPSLGQLVWTQGLFTDYTPTAGLSATPTVTLDTYSLSKGSSGAGTAFTNACTPIPGAPNANNNTTPSTIGATPSGTAYCDPIYPFQYGTSDNGDVIDGTTLTTDFFYDAPEGPWLTGAFRGITLLSTGTYDTNSLGVVTGNILTVYQGVDYGFDLSTVANANDTRTIADLATVPEPAALGLLGLGLAATVASRGRRRTRMG